jgi:hypothetical protein
VGVAKKLALLVFPAASGATAAIEPIVQGCSVCRVKMQKMPKKSIYYIQFFYEWRMVKAKQGFLQKMQKNAYTDFNSHLDSVPLLTKNV